MRATLWIKVGAWFLLQALCASVACWGGLAWRDAALFLFVATFFATTFIIWNWYADATSESRRERGRWLTGVLSTEFVLVVLVLGKWWRG